MHKLGYVFRADFGLQVSEGPVFSLYRKLHQKPVSSWKTLLYKEIPPLLLPRRTIRVCILGDNRVGKSSFVWHVSGLRPPGVDADVEVGTNYPKPMDHIVVGGCRQSSMRSSTLSQLQNNTSFSPGAVSAPVGTMIGNSSVAAAAMAAVTLAPHLTSPYFISFSAIPMDHYQRWMMNGLPNCDAAILMFQCGSMDSLDAALDIEQSLPLDLPRIFVGTKADLVRSSRIVSPNSPKSRLSGLEEQHRRVMDKIYAYTQSEGLAKVTLVSTMEETQGIAETLDSLRSIVVNPEWGLPMGNRKALQKKPRMFLENPRILISTAVGFVSLTALLVYYRKEVKDWMSSLMIQTRELMSKWIGPVGFIGFN